jgi:hypothetical protein
MRGGGQGDGGDHWRACGMKETAAVPPKLLAVLPICFPIAFSGKQHPALNELTH